MASSRRGHHDIDELLGCNVDKPEVSQAICGYRQSATKLRARIGARKWQPNEQMASFMATNASRAS